MCRCIDDDDDDDDGDDDDNDVDVDDGFEEESGHIGISSWRQISCGR